MNRDRKERSMRRSRLQWFLQVKEFRVRRSRSQCSFKSQKSRYRCEGRDYSDSSSLKNEAYIHKSRNLCCNAYERILIISKDFDVKKKARVRYSEFKSTKQCESNFDRVIEFEWSWRRSIWSNQQQIFDSIQQAHTFEYVSKCVYDWTN